jgi:sigma-B regulation protein RsbU (phosphoserine phosphatase)
MSAPPDVRVDVHLVSHPRFIQFVRLLAGEGASLAGFGDEDRGRIELAVVEGFTNVIRHGYGGRTDQRVDIRLEAPPGRLRIEFVDWATFVDPSKIVSRPLDQVRPGGLGVHLMKSTMDVVEYLKNAQGGTTLVLEKRVSPT